MKRKILIIMLLIIICFSNIYASTEDEKIIYAMLMNQIQFSLATMEYHQNRLVIDQEYENIICKIDKTKLKDDDSRTEFSNMLQTLTNLKLLDNEKIFIKEQTEKEKSEAVYKSLSNVGTGIGVATLSFAKRDIISAIAGLLYTGVSTAFSYKDALNNAENRGIKELFKINQETLKTLSYQKNKLWDTYSGLIVEYDIPKKYEIKQDQMSWLVETLNKTDSNEIINLLEHKKDIFSIFSPYWFELGSAYQKIGNIKKAEECYDIFEKQKSKYSIIDNDTYYTELAKNRIAIAKERNDLKSIDKYLTIIAQDKTVANESENRFYMAGVYLTIDKPEEALKLLKLIIDDKRQYVMQARTLYEYIDAVTASDNNYKKILLFSQLKIATQEEVKSVVISEKGDTNIFIDAKNFLIGNETERVIYAGNLVFFLPTDYENKYSLSILIDGKYYDSIPIYTENRQYFFIDYKLKDFCKNMANFSLILNGQNGDELTLDFSATYLNSGRVKLLEEACSIINNDKLEIDMSSVEYFNVLEFLTSYEQLKKGEDYKKIDDATKKKYLTDSYNLACKRVLSEPYYYKKYFISDNTNNLFIYGLTSFSDKSKKYEVTKYGELMESDIKISTFTDSLKSKYTNALIGDSENQYQLGMAYFNGEGIDINYFEAIKWFKLSAVSGNMNAYYQLGLCFKNGYGTKKNNERADYYFQKAADLGHKKAKEMLR